MSSSSSGGSLATTADIEEVEDAGLSRLTREQLVALVLRERKEKEEVSQASMWPTIALRILILPAFAILVGCILPPTDRHTAVNALRRTRHTVRTKRGPAQSTSIAREQTE